jgi:hypothetical protein
MIAEDAQSSYSRILAEHDIERAQRNKRTALLQKLSSEEMNGSPGPHGTISHLSQGALTGIDVSMLANVLLAIGDVKTLNLILESPGGDGTQVEKFVSLCRNQCERFRVIIPNEAKSAATLIALGADEIVMGPTSELGPIDAQIPAIVSGVFRYVSAQSFIDARDDALKQYAERKANNQDVEPILQMITTLDLPFVAECERLMEFGRDVGKKLLCEYMFKDLTDADVRADGIVRDLSSVEIYKVHGRRITGPMARTMGLQIKACGRNDVFWKEIFEYYQRATICTSRTSAVKLFETEHDMFTAAARQEASS